MVDRSGQEVTDVVGLFYARASLTEPPLRLAKDAPSVPVSWSSIGHRPTGSLAPLGADSLKSRDSPHEVITRKTRVSILLTSRSLLFFLKNIYIYVTFIFVLEIL